MTKHFLGLGVANVALGIVFALDRNRSYDLIPAALYVVAGILFLLSWRVARRRDRRRRANDQPAFWDG